MAICAFCGRTVASTTSDHVPPRNLFGMDSIRNLITVPACLDCNNSTSKDDEYFRLIALDIEASTVPVAQQAAASTLRALNRPQARGFREAVYGTLQPVELRSQNGLLIANTFTLNVSMNRLLRTVEKTIRGLFFHHKGYSIPEGYRVWCHCLKTINEAGRRTYDEQIAPAINDTPIVEVAERVFRYRWGCLEDTPDIMFFQLGFYERFDFIGCTRCTRPVAEDMCAESARPAAEAETIAAIVGGA